MVIDAEFLLSTVAFFGMILIVALATGHLLGTAKVPALVNRIPVLIGSFTLSAVLLRIIFAVASSAGVKILEYRSEQGWIYNNPDNVAAVNEFLANNPALCIGLILFAFAAAMFLGGLGGWLLSAATLKLEPIFILMVTFALTDIGCVFGRSITWVGGGTLGLNVPDLLIFIPGNQHATWAIIILAIAAVVYFLIGRIESSPWGRLVTATSDNPVTAASIGKNVAKIRGITVFYTSGIMALAGTLFSLYDLYVIESPFHNWIWLFYPLTAILLGGISSRRSTVIGTIILFTILRSIIIFKEPLQMLLFFPVSYIESVITSLLILAALFLLPRGLIREKRKPIKGRVYDGVITDSS